MGAMTLHRITRKALTHALRGPPDPILAIDCISIKALLRALPPASPWAQPWVQKARLLAALDAGGIVTHYELIDAMWGDDPEGGPVDAGGAVKVQIWRLRHWHGYEIVTHHARGYELQRNLAAGD